MISGVRPSAKALLDVRIVRLSCSSPKTERGLMPAKWPYTVVIQLGETTLDLFRLFPLMTVLHRSPGL